MAVLWVAIARISTKAIPAKRVEERPEETHINARRDCSSIHVHSLHVFLCMYNCNAHLSTAPSSHLKYFTALHRSPLSAARPFLQRVHSYSSINKSSK